MFKIEDEEMEGYCAIFPALAGVFLAERLPPYKIVHLPRASGGVPNFSSPRQECLCCLTLLFVCEYVSCVSLLGYAVFFVREGKV